MREIVLNYLDRSIATFDGDPPANEWQSSHLATLKLVRAELGTLLDRVGPLPLLLFCPMCGDQHVDTPDPANGWDNPPHRSHLCGGCGCVWRPADVPTVGVSAIETYGKADTWRGALFGVAPAFNRDQVLEEAAQVVEQSTSWGLSRTRLEAVRSFQSFAAKAIRAQRSDSVERRRNSEPAPVDRFLAERTESHETSRVPAPDLHAAYCSWCFAHGLSTISPRAFSTALVAKGFQKIRSAGVQWAGLRLLEAEASAV